MAVRDPFFIDQRHLAVVDIYRRAALVPARLRAEDGRFRPALSPIVAAGNEQPARMADHVEGVSGTEKDFVHHRQPRRRLAPGPALVVGKQHADLVAGPIIAQVRFGTVQGGRTGPAVINGHHVAAGGHHHDGGGVKKDTVRTGRGGNDLLRAQDVPVRTGTASAQEQDRQAAGQEQPVHRPRKASIPSTSATGKAFCSPLTRFFRFTCPASISLAPVMDRKEMDLRSAYSNCFLSLAASG